MERLKLKDLDVIGYSDTPAQGMLPIVVPPVYGLRADPGVVFVPPYMSDGVFVYGSNRISREEAEDLQRKEEIVLFEKSFPAQSVHTLWLDQSLVPRYMPTSEAYEIHKQIADKHIDMAEQALREGDLVAAEKYACVAICADQKRIEPVAIQCVIRRKENDVEGEKLMAKLVSPYLKAELFALLVEHYRR
jgi:hypothetical protein